MLRKEEKTAIENAEPMNIYIDTDYINKEYEENFKIEQAYAYLKTIDKFKDSEDI